MAITIEGGIDIGGNITIGAGTTPPPPPPAPSIYSGSGIFNGAYFDVTETAGLSFGSGDFTIEAWIYPTGAGSNRRFFSQTYFTSSITQQCLRQTSGNKLQYFFNQDGSGLINITGSTNLNFNAWNHCAIVRSGSTFTLYQNGVSVASGSYGGSLPNMITAGLVLGISNAGVTENWAGNISNYRIVKGVAVYTGAYTIPTSEFTTTQSANPFGGSNTSAISAGQTQLLLNTFTNEAVNTDNSGYSVTVTNNGVTSETLNPFLTPADMFAVAWSPPTIANPSGLFAAVGYGDITPYPLYATSSDGITWTAPAQMGGSGSNPTSINAVTVNSSGLFVAVGSDGQYGYPAYSTSTDGTTWTAPALMNGSNVMANMRAVAVNSSGLFVSLGSNSSGRPVYATSSDGTTWTTPTLITGSTSIAYMVSIAVNSSGLFVAVGYNGTYQPLYSTSTNGSNWTVPALMNGSTAGAVMDGVTVNSSGLFVAVGGQDLTGYPLYATSSNGSTWTTPALMNGSTSFATMTSVAVNSSGLFVAIGQEQDPNAYPLYATSSNGSNWTTPARMNGSTTPAYVFGVAVNTSGLFVAVGYEPTTTYPRYAKSSNGSNWTTPAYSP